MQSGSEWVIFDLDGTLVESEQVWRDVRARYVSGSGGTWHDRAQQDMMGMRTEEWSRYMHDRLGVSRPPDAIARDVIDGVIAELSRHLPILPGAAQALERLAAAFRLGLATSAALPVAQHVLEQTEWNRFFEAVVSADQVARGKPAPDVYLRTIDLLRANPRRTAAIEDSGNGLRSAAAAGLTVIAIPNREYPPDATALALSARVLDKLDELDAPLVRAAIGEERV